VKQQTVRNEASIFEQQILSLSLSRNYPSSIEPDGSLPISEDPANGYYP
jgi:hypothetical protein